MECRRATSGILNQNTHKINHPPKLTNVTNRPPTPHTMNGGNEGFDSIEESQIVWQREPTPTERRGDGRLYSESMPELDSAKMIIDAGSPTKQERDSLKSQGRGWPRGPTWRLGISARNAHYDSITIS
nr:hypothetical protein [Tanacetum cinerariifolium]